MPGEYPATLATSSIIDNREGNTLLAALKRIGEHGRDLRVAAAFFSLDALVLLADQLEQYERIRILFGDDASPRQRQALLRMLRMASDRDLLAQRERDMPLLGPLRKIEALFAAGRVEARCYTAQKFHAKAYLVQRDVFPPQLGVLGSGNFTRPGLLQNIELNALLTPEQTAQLDTWYEDRWAEATDDVVTEDLLAEIRRQLDLYDPFILYLKALYLWGQYRQGASPEEGSRLLQLLDKHQEEGYYQALRILERESGVMVCDGVGLGKSFIALALMDYFCRAGKNVLLIAPKNILTNSWAGYLKEYLARYRSPFGNIHEMAMTEFGFDPGDKTQPRLDLLESDDREMENPELVQRLAERADVVVIDESHNFRTRSANRYVNLYRVLEPTRGAKQIIMLTATPINTYYTDLSSQLALITHERGSIGGYGVQQIRKAAGALDRSRPEPDSSGALTLRPGVPAGDILERVLQQVVIQRSRTTCRELSRAAGRTLHFPRRHGPTCVDYAIGPESQRYREVIALADRRFRPGVRYFEEVRRFIRNQGPDAKIPRHLERGPELGIKLAAFVLEQYRYQPAPGGKPYQDEIHLARLVFANTLKQLESSPPALQGILQSLGIGLLARLRFVFGAEHAGEWVQHLAWVKTPLFDDGPLPTTDERPPTTADGEQAPFEPQRHGAHRGGTEKNKKKERNNEEEVGRGEETDDQGQTTRDLPPNNPQSAIRNPQLDVLDDGESLDASGEEADDWLEAAIRSRQLLKKLGEFRAKGQEYDLARWKADILSDLGFLQEIHQAVLQARTQPDPKLEKLAPVIAGEIAAGRRVLVFTQSVRTAEYLERELKQRFPGSGVARIDSRVEDTRAAIIHAFCPGYNPPPPRPSPSVPDRVDVLISTDVLSEGVNLQEAGAILNYDIHWNPVRLIQRIGRVDRRLDPQVTPEPHSFTIYNVLPPPEIEQIINLVALVEDRTLKISRAVGIDQAFFTGDDPADSLKEFNRLYEGEITRTDSASAAYIRHFDQPDPQRLALLDALPPGAFGVWDQAPENGLFALFCMEAAPEAPNSDREAFAAVLGRPVLALEREGKPPLLDAGEVLAVLSPIPEGVHSGTPSDEASLALRLRKLRDAVRGHFAEIALPRTIRPRLVCWMELKKGPNP